MSNIVRWQSPVTGRTVRLHFNSRIARLGGGVNNCMTLTKDDILISRDWIGPNTLAHEDGHTITAEKRGWLYLPWVLVGYVWKGYARAQAEKEADDYMRANAHRYHAIGPVPSWAVGA
jgi:hypothetical protein